ncbi:MAG: metallophosphoesterase [Nitrospirae bacterium]|nr:MAG: metallophosphoesterase [Nitrospirota bacterium]
MIDNTAILALEKRVGSRHLAKRLQLQTEHSAIRLSQTGVHIYWEQIDALGPLLKALLTLCGLYRRAVRNSIDYAVETVTVPIPQLPPAFHGFRILQLSDLHVENIVDRGKRLREVIQALEYDLCVITGDFRFLTYGDYENAVICAGEVTTAIRCPHGIVGVLGNHDFIEMVPGLEKYGIRLLLNESLPIQRGSDTVWIVGVDDPHWYEVDDLEKALQEVPPTAVKLLLAHSPELLDQACRAGIDYYLCGHSHGGQICLPGRVPIINNSACARRYISGPWRYQDRMAGYTSRGTGASLLPVRLFCRPEVTIHQLVVP